MASPSAIVYEMCSTHFNEVLNQCRWIIPLIHLRKILEVSLRFLLLSTFMFRYNIKYLQSVCFFVPLALDFKSEPSDEDYF